MKPFGFLRGKEEFILPLGFIAGTVGRREKTCTKLH